MKQISSIQNPYIKSLILLQEKSKARKQSGNFLIEGVREIAMALKGGYKIETILFLSELIPEIEIKKFYFIILIIILYIIFLYDNNKFIYYYL